MYHNLELYISMLQDIYSDLNLVNSPILNLPYKNKMAILATAKIKAKNADSLFPDGLQGHVILAIDKLFNSTTETYKITDGDAYKVGE